MTVEGLIVTEGAAKDRKGKLATRGAGRVSKSEDGQDRLTVDSLQIPSRSDGGTTTFVVTSTDGLGAPNRGAIPAAPRRKDFAQAQATRPPPKGAQQAVPSAPRAGVSTSQTSVVKAPVQGRRWTRRKARAAPGRPGEPQAQPRTDGPWLRKAGKARHRPGRTRRQLPLVAGGDQGRRGEAGSKGALRRQGRRPGGF